MWKTWLKDVLIGLGIIVAVFILELVVMIPFGGSTGTDRSAAMRLEFALAALPALVVSVAVSGLPGTKSPSSAWRRSLLWTIMLFAVYALIGAGNGDIREILSVWTLYLLLAGVFLGPWIRLAIQKRKQRN